MTGIILLSRGHSRGQSAAREPLADLFCTSCRLSWALPNERAVTVSGGLGADHRSDTACSVGLIVRSAPVHNLLPHAHFRHSYTPPYIYPSPCGLPRVQRSFLETASLSLPSCVLRILRSNRSPPSTERFELLRRQQRQQQLAARYLAFLSRPPISLLYSARPPGWAASSRPHSNRTYRACPVPCCERLCMMVRKAPIHTQVSSTSLTLHHPCL